MTARDIVYGIVAAGRDPEKTVLSSLPTLDAAAAPDDAVLAAITEAVCETGGQVFTGLSPVQIRHFLKEASLLRVDAGALIIRQGDPGNDLFLVLRGNVDVRRRINGAPRSLVTLRPGQIFGELAFLGNIPRTADAVALTAAEILILSQSGFLRMTDAAPETALMFLRNLALVLCERLANSTNVQAEILTDSERLKTQQEADRRRTLSQMVAGVAHEINTPLGIANHAASIIAGLASDLASDLAKAPPGQDGGREMLEDMLRASTLLQQNIARADHLVQTFKALSVSQAIDRLERVALRKVTRDTVDLYRLKARSSQLVVSLIDRLGEADDEDEWEGYPGHYAQILLNLLTNADRYAYPNGGGGKVDIEMSAAERAGTDGGFTVVVRDFGCGIAAKDLERVFEPFFTTGRGKGGTGLGLPIVKNLVTNPCMERSTSFQNPVWGPRSS